MGNKTKLINDLPNILDSPIFCIQEHFKAGNNSLQVSGLSTLQKNRKNGYGGVSISISKKKLHQDFGWSIVDFEFGSCEAIPLKLDYRYWNKAIIVCSIYLPPNDNWFDGFEQIKF